MANRKFYTREKIEEARNTLDNLPDLKQDKISTTELLESLKSNIITLSASKGYSASEIKSALSAVGITVSARAISELIRASEAKKKKRRSVRKDEA